VPRVNGDKEDLYPFKHQVHVGNLFNIDVDTPGNLGLPVCNIALTGCQFLLT
jgi:hypothetical protein